MEGTMIRVAIVDTHPVARRGLMAILSTVPDVDVVALAADPAGLWRTGLESVDVVVGDPYPLGEPAWLPAIRDLTARVAVLVVSASRDPADAAAAMQAGARGYLTKHTRDEGYVAAIRAVAAGGVYLGQSLVGVPGGPNGASRVPPLPVLSDREQEALAYIGRGFTHQQTARRMGVSKATVDTYIGRIRTKLRVGNKAELALAALRYVEPRHRHTAGLAASRSVAA
jgi:two-component system, NarL family, nitrate/nitrite response regulator NarL